MIHMSVSKYLCSNVVLSVCYLINRMSSSVLNKSAPFSCLYANKTPFSVTPHVIGCTCFVQDLSPGLDKLSLRSIKCVIVGYSRTQKGYRCYNLSPESIWYRLMSHFLSLFRICLHMFLSPYLRLFLLHCLCYCLHLLLLFLRQCWQQKLQIHLHQSQFRISDTSTPIAQRFLSPNQFRLIPLR